MLLVEKVVLTRYVTAQSLARKGFRPKEKEHKMKNAMIARLASKSKESKGFTLIEVIVVLVILAILAAIAIPALTGYIDKASDRAVISEAHNAQVALQALAVDQYANGEDITTYFTGATWQDDVDDLVGTTGYGDKISNPLFTGTALESFTYTSDSGVAVVYDKDDGYTVQ